MNFKSVSELTKEQIEDLKAEHGRVFKINVCDTDYIIRPLYKADQERISKILKENPEMQMTDLDDKVVELGLIGPKPDFTKGGWATLPAGVAPTISRYISAKSGFIVPELPDVCRIGAEPLYDPPAAAKPSEEEIEALKQNCPHKLRLLTIEHECFIVRPLTRAEWRQLSTGNDDEQDRAVASRVALWPASVDWDALPAGYPTTISQFAMEISGFNAISKVEEL